MKNNVFSFFSETGFSWNFIWPYAQWQWKARLWPWWMLNY